MKDGTMVASLIAPELQQLIRRGDLTLLRNSLRDMPAVELAEIVEALSVEEMVVVFRVLPRPLAADVFEYLELESQEELLRGMGKGEIAQLLDDMAPDDRTELFEELPAQATRQMLSLLSREELQVAKTLLGYPEYSVGRLMTTDYVAIRAEWTISEVLDHIRRHGRDSETLNVLYVVDDVGRLLDDIRVREILLASPDKKIAELMDHHITALQAFDDQEEAVAAFRKYDRVALPVTDSEGMLIGILTIDDVLDVAEEEATEDIHKMGGLSAIETPYMATPVFGLVRKRAGWLVTLFIGEMLTATAMGYFEEEIARAVVLALFVPLIISSGGNSGSQAATLVIRALALGEVGLRDWWHVVRREVIAGLALGSLLGAVGFLRVSAWSMWSDIYGPHWLLIAFTVGFSLIGVVMLGTLVGSTMPLIMKRLGADPATSSTPFVATFVDVSGLIIYFAVAAVILSGTVL